MSAGLLFLFLRLSITPYKAADTGSSLETTPFPVMTESEPPVFRTTIFDHANDITKEAALKICSDHLEGEWKKIGTDDLDLSVVQ